MLALIELPISIILAIAMFYYGTDGHR